MSSLLVFNGIHRLETQSVMLAFSTQLCELVPLSPSPWFNPPPPFPCVNNVYMYTVCKGGYGVLDLRQINNRRKVPLMVNF
jgi:hypothetical protein